MLSVYRIFQMIFGIIVSFSILYFLISYSGNYAEVQRNAQRAEIIKAFGDEVRDVYLSGVSTNFTHFRKYDFSSCYIKPVEKSPAEMVCEKVSGIPIETPVVFYPGREVYVGRDSLDYGWWVFNFVEAMPSLTFVFNPIDGTQDEIDLMKDIVWHIPDTSDEWSIVKVKFAMCDGNEVVYVCGGHPCTKDDFMSILSSSPSQTGKCTAKLNENMRLVTLSASCDQYFSQTGLCILPPNSIGVGNAFLSGSAKTYVYKDPLDLVALSVGGSEKDVFGETAGEKMYDYKNSVLMERLSLASEVISKRSVLIAGKTPAECGQLYIELSQVLDGIPGKDYNSISDMYDLNERLNKGKELYQKLLDIGCERLEI